MSFCHIPVVLCTLPCLWHKMPFCTSLDSSRRFTEPACLSAEKETQKQLRVPGVLAAPGMSPLPGPLGGQSWSIHVCTSASNPSASPQGCSCSSSLPPLIPSFSNREKPGSIIIETLPQLISAAVSPHLRSPAASPSRYCCPLHLAQAL